MWHDIFMANRVQMTIQIDQFRQTLDLLASMIANNDSRSLEASLTVASTARKKWQLTQELPAK
jgi:prephenate dehydrogenase